MSTGKTIAIGSDHAGFAYKSRIIAHLREKGYTVEDYGTNSSESTDYPDYAHPVGVAVSKETADRGILVCGSGNGVCMTVNKHKGVRGALAWNAEIASLARQHNDANVLCLPERFIGEELAIELVNIFLDTEFEGGRHARRAGKIG